MSKSHKLKHHVGLCFKTEFTLTHLALYTTTSLIIFTEINLSYRAPDEPAREKI